MSGLVLAVGAAMVWGLVYALDEQIMKSVSPATLIFLSSLLSGLIAGGYLLVKGESLHQEFEAARAVLPSLALTLICSSAAGILIIMSIRSIGAAQASIIEISYPIFVVAFSAILFKGTFHPSFFIGAALVFAGSSLVAFYSSEKEEVGSTIVSVVTEPQEQEYSSTESPAYRLLLVSANEDTPAQQKRQCI